MGVFENYKQRELLVTIGDGCVTIVISSVDLWGQISTQECFLCVLGWRLGADVR